MKTAPLKSPFYYAVPAAVLYGLILVRQPAIADTNISTCASNLATSSEKYILTANVTGPCNITANGIIIDGQGLYTITGDVNGAGSAAAGHNFTLQNIIVTGNVLADAGFVGGSVDQSNGGNVTISTSTIQGNITSTTHNTIIGGHHGGNGGTVTISHSSVFNIDTSAGGGGYSTPGNGGNVTITDSTANGTISTISNLNVDSPQISGATGTLTLISSISTNPSITVNPLSVTIGGEAYTNLLSGVTASDAQSHDLTSYIQTSGTVGNPAGSYVINYLVATLNRISVVWNGVATSSGSTATGSRTVTRSVAFGTSASTPAVSGGHSGGQHLSISQMIAMGIMSPSVGTSGGARDLKLGMTGDDVKALQQYLNTHGFTVAITGYFGPLTKAALIKFQTAHTISPASGYFGPITRAYVNSH